MCLFDAIERMWDWDQKSLAAKSACITGSMAAAKNILPLQNEPPKPPKPPKPSYAGAV